MIDLEGLSRQLHQLRIDLATIRDSLIIKADQAAKAHRTAAALEMAVRDELSRLHEKQPEV